MDRDLHTEEVKIRLTQRDASLLKGLAQHRDLPFSVLARMIVVRGLDGMTTVSARGRDNQRPA